MIGAKLHWLVVGALALNSSLAGAEDDLLNLLEGKSNETAVLAKSPIRKVLNNPNAEQNIFLNFFEAQQYESALNQFSSAFPSTESLGLENHRALESYLWFQNGLQMSAMGALLSLEHPTAINPELIQMWRQILPETHRAWSIFLSDAWNSEWTQVWGVNTEIRIKGRSLSAFKDLDTIKELISKSRPGTSERNLLQWQLILGLSETDTSKAAQALSHLMKQPNNPIAMDLMQMTAARMLYQNGYLDAAISYYEKVPRVSDYWLEAQEEIAWSSLRKGRPQDTLAVTTTLSQPQFVALAGPESLFVRTVAQLKVCDYQGVKKSLTQFKDNFRQRTVDLLALEKDAKLPEVDKLIEKRIEGHLELIKMGSYIRKLPRQAARDTTLGALANFSNELKKEAAIAEQIFNRSMSQASSKVGFQSQFAELKNRSQEKSRIVNSQVYGRIQDMAREEIKEIQEILSKLHVVEAEVMQQGMMAGKIADGRRSVADSQTGRKNQRPHFQMEFPVKDEIWFDELANLNVNITGSCGAKARVE